MNAKERKMLEDADHIYPSVSTKTDSEKLSFLIGELRSLYLILERSILSYEGLKKSSLSKDAYVILLTGMNEAYKEVQKYIDSILEEIE